MKTLKWNLSNVRVKTVLGVSTLFILVICASLYSVFWSGAKIALSAGVLDFGMFETNSLEKESLIFLQNKGSKPLKILDVYRTCDCIELKSRPSVIPAGSKGVFRFKMNLYPTDFNTRKVKIIIQTDSIEYPKLEFKAFGVVNKSFYVMPGQLDFKSRRDFDSVVEQLLTVNLYGYDESVSVLGVHANPAVFSVSPKTEEHRQTIRLTKDRKNVLRSREYLIKLDVSKLRDSTKDEIKENIKINLSNGESLNLPVTWKT